MSSAASPGPVRTTARQAGIACLLAALAGTGFTVGTRLGRGDRQSPAGPAPHTALKIVAPDLDDDAATVDLPATVEPAATPVVDSPAVPTGPPPSDLAIIGRRPFDDGPSASPVPVRPARPVPEPTAEPPGQRDFEQGRRLLRGEGMPIDRNQAFQVLERAAEQGHPVACTFVAEALAAGWGGNAAGQYAKADAWNRRALPELGRLAALGDPDALLALGELHLAGTVVPRDIDRARSLMRRAAEAGHPHAPAHLALELAADAETDTDKAEVFRLLERAVERGSVAGMTALGQAHERGTNGAEQNEPEAFRLLREAALKNDDGAVHSLAHMAQDGRGTAKDETLAVRLFQHALELSPGCDCKHAVCLANCFFDGVGVEQDPARGMAILVAAAETNAAAMLDLADRIAEGRGVKQDAEKAEGWYRRALESYRKLAERGDDGAAITVGRFYASGAGVPQDSAEARRWFERARGSRRASIVREATEQLEQLDRGDGSI